MTLSNRVGGILAQATKTDKNKPPRMVIYGPPGTGKTTFAARAPNPIIINLEDGGDVLHDPITGERLVVTVTPRLTTFDDFLTVIDELLNTEHEFKTIVVDTISKLDQLMQEKVLQEAGLDHLTQTVADIPYGRGKPAMVKKWEQVSNKMAEIYNKGTAATILLGHTTKEQVMPPDGEAYTKWSIKMFAPETCGPSVTGNADFVGFMNLDYGVTRKKEGMKDHNRAVMKGLKMDTGTSITSDAKNRYNMPDSIEPFWECFKAYLPGSDTQSELMAFKQHQANYSTN